MVERIAKLTQKIYQEGIEKARREANQIIAEAQHEKNRILESGRAEVEQMINGARRMAEDVRKKTDSDILMASNKALSTLRQRIEDMITTGLADEAARDIGKDKHFLTNIVEKVIEKWEISDHTNDALLIKLSKDDVKELEKYFFSKAQKILKTRITFKQDARIRAGFYIEEVLGKYKVGFTDEDFKEFFQYFLQPRIRQFLFGKGKK